MEKLLELFKKFSPKTERELEDEYLGQATSIEELEYLMKKLDDRKRYNAGWIR